MIRYQLRERISEMEAETGRKISLTEIANETGLNRVTLSKIARRDDYNATVNVLDRLCGFFDCEVGEVIEYVPDDKSGRSRSF